MTMSLTAPPMLNIGDQGAIYPLTARFAASLKPTKRSHRGKIVGVNEIVLVGKGLMLYEPDILGFSGVIQRSFP